MTDEEKQAESWTSGAKEWTIQEATFQPLYQEIIDNLHLTSNKALLDIGCGTGLFLTLASKHNCSISGIDISQNAIEMARQRLSHGTFELCSMEHLPFADKSFDFAVGNNSFQYAPDIPGAMKETFRVLQPNGKLVISVWGNPDDCESYAYFKVFNALTQKHEPDPVPFNLASEGKIENLFEQTGFDIGSRTNVVCSRYYPDLPTALKGILSSGPAKQAIQNASYDIAARKVAKSIEPFKQNSGTYKMDNTFVIAEGIRH